MGAVQAVAAPENGPTWTALILTVLSSSVLAGLITATIGNIRAAAVDRRQEYARVSRVLLRRVEFAYRVRRRISDDPLVLSELSALGSEIQEELAACKAWVATESSAVSDVLHSVCRAIDEEVGPATAEAWTLAPVSTASEMNLGEWGPRGHSAHLRRLQRAVACRFGTRRLIPARWWRGRMRVEAS